MDGEVSLKEMGMNHDRTAVLKIGGEANTNNNDYNFDALQTTREESPETEVDVRRSPIRPEYRLRGHN